MFKSFILFEQLKTENEQVLDLKFRIKKHAHVYLPAGFLFQARFLRFFFVEITGVISFCNLL